jgi:translation elongation factor EF-1alpha
MDSTLPAWSEIRFREIESKVKELLSHVKVNPNNVLSIPTSGLNGGNLVQRPSEEMGPSWYTGPTLLEALDGLAPLEPSTTGSLRALLNFVPSTSELASKRCDVGVTVLRGQLKVGRTVGIPRRQLAETAENALSSEVIAGHSMNTAGDDAAVAVISKIVNNIGMPVNILGAGYSGTATIESRWRYYFYCCYCARLILWS